MDVQASDALVIGAGIAGALTAAHLAADRRVALIGAEEATGYHGTRRSAAIIDLQPWVAKASPMVNDVDHNWYVRPEARTRLMVSPAAGRLVAYLIAGRDPGDAGWLVERISPARLSVA